MTTMDIANPLDQFTDAEKAITRRLYIAHKAGQPLDAFSPAEKETARRVYSAWKGATGNTGPALTPAQTGIDPGDTLRSVYAGGGSPNGPGGDLGGSMPYGPAGMGVNQEPWKAADPDSGFNRPGGNGLSPEERMIGVHPNFAGMAPAAAVSAQEFYRQTGRTDVPADQIPADWNRRGQQITPTAPSGLSPEGLAVAQQRAVRDIEVQRYADAMGTQGGGVIESAVRAPVHAVNNTLRGLLGMVDLQGNPALTEAVGQATAPKPEGMTAKVVSGATGMAPVLATGALGGTPMMLGAMGLQSFDDAFHAYQADLQHKGDLNATGKALAAAAAIAPIETALNAVPAHRFLGALETAAPGFGAFLKARAIDAATNAGIGAAADVTRQAGGVASGAQDQYDLGRTMEAIPEQAAVGGFVGGAMATAHLGARGERMGQVRDLRQAQQDARMTGGVPDRAGAYQPRPVNPWEQTTPGVKASDIGPSGTGTTAPAPAGTATPPRGALDSSTNYAHDVTKLGAQDGASPNVEPARQMASQPDKSTAVDLYPRASQILDEIGVPDAGEVADRLDITLAEADRLVGRWEQSQSAPNESESPQAPPLVGQPHDQPSGEDARGPDAERPSPKAGSREAATSGTPSPNSTRPALGSSRLGIPLEAVSEAQRQRDAAAENIARQSRPFAPPGRAQETERRSVLNRMRNPDTAGYSTEGSLTPEGVFADAEAQAAQRNPPAPDKSARPASADAAQESGRRPPAADTASPGPDASSPQSTPAKGKEPWQMDAYKGKPFAAFSAETGRTRIFTQSVKGDGGWQVTRFDKQGKPSGDTLYPSWDEAVRTEQRYGLKMETAHDPFNTHSWRKPLSEVVDAAQGSRILLGHEIGKLEMAVRREHQAVVEAALREGRPVPAEVLKDYPELKGKGAPAKGKEPWEMTREEYIRAQTTPQERAVSTRANKKFQPLVDAENRARDEYNRVDERFRSTIGEPGHEISKARRDAIARLEEASSRLRRAKASAGTPRGLDVLHGLAVRDALSEGRPVPAEVLKDYPELKTADTPQVSRTAASKPQSSRLEKLADTTPAKAAPSRPAFNGTIQFGEPRHGSTSGITGASKVVTAFHLDEAGEHTENRLEIVKPKYGNDWVLYRRGKDEMVSFGSQKIAKPKFDELGKADNLRDAKQAAEAVLRGEIDPATPHHDRLRPLEEFTPAPSRAWSGTTKVQGESPYETDGRAMFRRDAVAPSITAKLKQSEYGSAMGPEMLEDTWASSVKAAKTEGKEALVLGVVRDIGSDVAYLDLGGVPMAADAHRLKFLQDATKADRLVGTKPERPLVLFRGKEPVAILMPRKLPKDFDLSRAKGESTAPKSTLTRAADALAAKAAALQSGPGVRKGKGGKGTRAGASDLNAAIGYAALKAGEAILRTGEKIRVTVADAIEHLKRFGIDTTPENIRELRRGANSLLRASERKDGTFSEHKLEVARAEMRQSQSADVREGMAKRAGENRTRTKLSAQAQQHADEIQTQREAFSDALDTLKAKGEVGANIRKDLGRLAKEYLAPSDRGKVLDFILKARAKNAGDGAGDWFVGLKKILGVAETSERRRAQQALKDTVGNAKKAPGEKSLRAEIDADLVRKEPTYLIKDRIDPKKLAPEYKDAVQPLIDAIQANKSLSGLDTVANFIQDQTDRGLSNLFTEGELGVLRGLNNRSLKDKGVTAEQIHLVDRALHHIAFLDEHAHTARIEGKLRDVRDDATKAAGDLSGRVKKISQGWLSAANGMAARGERTGLVGSLRDFLGRTQRDLRTLVTVPFGKGSEAYRYLYDEIRKASSRRKLIEIRAAKELAKVATEHKIKPEQLGKDRKKKADIKDASGNVLDLTRAEAMHIVALHSDPESRNEIAKAGLRSERYRLNDEKVNRLTPEDIAAIERQLTPFERAYIAKFKEITNGDLRRQGNEVSNALDGYDLFTNPEHVSRSRDRKPTMREDSSAAHAWAENLGITKSRSSSTAPILVRDFYAFADDHLGKMASYIATAEPIRNARLFLSRDEVAGDITKRLGNSWTQAMLKRLEAVAGVAPRQTTRLGKLLGWMNRNNARTALWGRLSSAAQQISGVPLAMATMTGAERVHAARMLLDPRAYAGGLDTMKERSGYFADRYGSMNERLASGLAGEAMVPTTAAGRIYAKAIEAGFVPLQFMDERSAIFAYNVARAHLESTGLKGEALNAAAVDRAEQIIRESQNTTDDVDRSGMAIEAADSPLLAAWTMFSSPANKMRNLMEARIAAAMNNEPDSKRELAHSAVLVSLSLATSAALREMWKEQREGFRPNKRDWGDMAVSVVADAGNAIVPKLGDRIRNGVNAMRHKPVFEGDDSPTAGMLQLGAAIAEAADKSVSEDSRKDWGKIAERAMRGAGPSLGIPGMGPYEMIRGLYRMGE